MRIEKNQIIIARIVFFLFFLLLSVTFDCKAQEETDYGFTFTPIISPSPTVSSLGEHLIHPVDYYTGIPKINIPLYEISTQNISIPIQLNYHASGIRVDQMASWVGLGWSLQSGGYISRIVRGLPDDKNYWEPDGIYSNLNIGYLDWGQNVLLDLDALILHYITAIQRDGIPDLFQYQFGAFSGSFMFDENGTIRLIPENDLNFSFSRNSITHDITGFTITTPDGTKYFFNTIEATTVASLTWTNYFYNQIWQYNFLNVNIGSLEVTQKRPFNSTWYLSKIVTTGSTEEIIFSYREENQLNRAISDETEDEYLSSISQTASAHFITAKLPETITWSGGKIMFNMPIQRRLDSEKNPNHNFNNYSLALVSC